ncbi:MAG TPA: arginase [Candidatus Polarisedimenticolia bacterium]|nr:arginase [Candidatus Polarisedimenticolia bacterium]
MTKRAGPMRTGRDKTAAPRDAPRRPTAPRGPQATRRQVEVIGIPLDLGAGRRGVDMGPSAFRLTGLAKRIEILGHEVVDRGDVEVPIPEGRSAGDPRKRFVTEIAAACRALAEMTAAAVAARRTPVCLGGDHSLAAGSIPGVARALRARGQELAVVWVDAHADMNTPETSPSGNVHGMPLAACLGQGPQELVAIAGGASVRPENVALIGIRNLDEREKTLVHRSGVRAGTMSDIDRRGLAPILEDLLRDFTRSAGGIHLSLDLDGLDPEVAPGVGTPVRGGLSYREAHLLCEMVSESGRLVSIDVAELNPTLDVRNHSAEVGTELILSALGQRIL